MGGLVFRGQVIFTAIDVPGVNSTIPYGINDSGQIVGAYNNNGTILNDGPNGGFLLDGGVFSLFGENIAIQDINNSGDMVGYLYQAAFFSLGWSIVDGVEVFSNPLNQPSTQFFGINDDQVLVGVSLGPGCNYCGFVLDGGVATVNPLGVPGDQAQISGISNSRIAGISVNGGISRGWVQNGGSFVFVDVPGASNTYVLGINDRTQLVGFYTDSQSNLHGFLATPVPEPASVGLIGAAAAFFIVQLRKKSKS